MSNEENFDVDKKYSDDQRIQNEKMTESSRQYLSKQQQELARQENERQYNAQRQAEEKRRYEEEQRRKAEDQTKRNQEHNPTKNTVQSEVTNFDKMQYRARETAQESEFAYKSMEDRGLSTWQQFTERWQLRSELETMSKSEHKAWDKAVEKARKDLEYNSRSPEEVKKDLDSAALKRSSEPEKEKGQDGMSKLKEFRESVKEKVEQKLEQDRNKAQEQSRRR